MTQVGQDTDPADNLAASAAKWDVAGYGSWVRTGLDRWFHPRTTPGGRAVAFRPLILNPDRDPVAPLIDAVDTVPGGRERLRDAVSESLAVWTEDSSHSGPVLDALLRLAQRLPTLNLVFALRRLLQDGHLNDQPRKGLLALQLLDTAMELVALPEGTKFLGELRHYFWQPSFAASWLEGMAKANKIDWLEGLLELRGDLERTDPTGENVQPVIRRMADRAGGAGAVLKRLRSPGTMDPWLENVLFGGERPALNPTRERFADTKNQRIPALVIGGEIAPLEILRINYGLDKSERPENLDEIVSRRLFAPVPEGSVGPASRSTGRRRGRSGEEIWRIIEADASFFETRH
jgi:hypothetical protein